MTAKAMTLKQAAKKLGCSVEYLRARIRAGDLPQSGRTVGGATLVAEKDLASLPPPKRKFGSGKRKSSLIAGREPAFDMRVAVGRAVSGLFVSGWKPKNDADRRVIEAMVEYLAN